MGETQIALRFAYQTKERRPDYSIFWVPVLSDELAEQARYRPHDKDWAVQLETRKPNAASLSETWLVHFILFFDLHVNNGSVYVYVASTGQIGAVLLQL
jgi:hypothetical protein